MKAELIRKFKCINQYSDLLVRNRDRIWPIGPLSRSKSELYRRAYQNPRPFWFWSAPKKSDSVYARATEIFYRKFGKKWDGENYEKKRTYENNYGYTSSYLWWSVNKEDYSSSASLTDMEKLARLDLRKGATIPELVLDCCSSFPKKTAIKKIIEIGKELVVLNGELTNSTKEELAKETFNFRDQDGNNCLMALFSLPSKYHNKKEKRPDNEPMMHEIEISCRFLIQYAKSNNVDLMTILNSTTKHGQTLFFRACLYSEPVAEYLLEYDVNVNSIDSLFQTPGFRVRKNFASKSLVKSLVSRTATKNDRPGCKPFCCCAFCKRRDRKLQSLIDRLVESSNHKVNFLFNRSIQMFL